MEYASSTASRPNVLMRGLLALLLALATLLAGLPAVLLLVFILVGGLAVAAAVALAHTGGLAEDVFARSHWAGLVGLALLLVGAFVRRARTRVPWTTMERLRGALTRWPWMTAALVLAVLTAVVVHADWDGGWRLEALSAALILDDFYFFSAVGTVLMLVGGVKATLFAHRWSSAGRYRTGLVTSFLAIFVALLLFGGTSEKDAAQPLAQGRIAAPLRAQLAPLRNASSLLERERQMFAIVDGLVESRVPPGPPCRCEP
jgi:hypothetical protein